MTNKETTPDSYKPREFFTGGGPRRTPPITGSVTAIDVKTGKIVAKQETKYPMLGGVLATAGGLVFVGYPDGPVVALDAKTLKELWRSTPAPASTPRRSATASMASSTSRSRSASAAPGRSGSSIGTKGLEKMQPGSMLFVFSL